MSFLPSHSFQEFDFDEIIISEETIPVSESYQCEECDREINLNQMYHCSSCSRNFCEECFLSDFETICYNCYADESSD